MRLLHQRRRQRRLLVDLEMLAAEFEILVCPDPADDLDRLHEHLARLCLRHTERVEFDRLEPAADAHVEAAVGQHVEHRAFLGHDQRIS